MMIFLKVCVSDADGDNLSFAYAGEASIFAQIQDRTVLIGKPASSITMGPNVRVKPAAWPGSSGLVSFTSMFLARQANRG
ncbi:hypothetical protein CFB84_15980 [Burkholderia aenigmatica]|uniref:Uncharacterized protein n=1 Tax=Burkholderia aenigmatica TaxID=2015348 RepID=A0A228IVP9_9BURK|nr:hypothetical protein CFB84_15980 [Burkholderia aenigmatica]